MPNVDPSVSLQISRDLSRRTSGYYKHYKGDLYRVLCVGLHADEQNYCVVYQSLYGNIYIRDYAVFHDAVDQPGGSWLARFQPLTGLAALKARARFICAYFFN